MTRAHERSLHADVSTGGASMNSLPPYLTLRNGTYYFKRKLPADVARLLEDGREQVWKSLATKDLEVALKRHAEEMARFELDVRKARSRKPRRMSNMGRPAERGTTKYLELEHIPTLLERFEHNHLQTDDEERAEMTREERDERLDFLESGLHWMYDRIAAQDFGHMEEVATDLLAGERLIGPPGSTVRLALLEALAAKDVEVMQKQADRLRGRYLPTPKQAPLAARDLPTLDTMFQAWARAQRKERTIGTYEGFVRDFEAVCRALPLASISSEHADAFRDEMLAWDLSKSTIRERLGGLATLWDYGLRKKLHGISENPFRGVDLDGIEEQPAHERRRPYEVEELRLLFNSPLYRGELVVNGMAKDAAFFAPLLGLYGGARLEEIAQLRVSDVMLVHGTWALRITNMAPRQSTKTLASNRLVPVHDELLRCGFLSHVDGVRASGHDRLFPSLEGERLDERWGGPLGTWFGRYLDNIGLDDNRLCFHSLRYTFKQWCTLSGVSTEVRDVLAGHSLSRGKGSAVYMRGADGMYPFPPLLDGIRLLRIGDLDLSHLHIQAV
jgi:integrase